MAQLKSPLPEKRLHTAADTIFQNPEQIGGDLCVPGYPGKRVFYDIPKMERKEIMKKWRIVIVISVAIIRVRHEQVLHQPGRIAYRNDTLTIHRNARVSVFGIAKRQFEIRLEVDG